MLNVYDYAYQLLYDATIECCNKSARFEFSELINFLITDNTKTERVFENYSEISINRHYLKKIMMLIITSCAYLVCEYKTALEINDDEVTEVLTMLENLKPQEIITLFHQKDSDLNKIYEYYQEYLAETDYMSVCANIIINDIDGEYFNYPVFMGSDVARAQVGGIITNVLAGNYTVEESFTQAYENTIRAMN